jgi:hypothetical protein
MLMLLNAWSATIALFISMEQSRMDRLTVAAAQVAPGVGEAEVIAALGEPDSRRPKRSGLAILLFGLTPRQWIYGTVFDADIWLSPESAFPYPLPINLRIFAPDDDDVVISWNDDGIVTAIDRP